jgi:hypothetical protein
MYIVDVRKLEGKKSGKGRRYRMAQPKPPVKSKQVRLKRAAIKAKIERRPQGR